MCHSSLLVKVEGSFHSTGFNLCHGISAILFFHGRSHPPDFIKSQCQGNILSRNTRSNSGLKMISHKGHVFVNFLQFIELDTITNDAH